MFTAATLDVVSRRALPRVAELVLMAFAVVAGCFAIYFARVRARTVKTLRAECEPMTGEIP